VSIAMTAVTALLRDEVSACRKEGLWDIRLA
jgi:LysR family nitrogen assimilation transcriptional regulator